MKRLNHQKFVLVPVGLLAVGLMVIGLAAWRHNNSCDLRLTSGCVHLERATTAKAQAKGLGGRDSLAPNQGMLFIYKSPQRACFWMKDTHFNLDMIWFDAAKTITMIKQNVSPATYPQSYCASNTQFVIELPASTVEQNQLSLGQQLNF